MIFKPLNNTSINEIVDCFNESFSEYEVKMPTSIEFWQNRWSNSGVDYKLSFGAFVDGRLVGFIINAIRKHDNVLTAYNTGTGVIKEFRGLRVVDKIYKFAKSKLKKAGVKKLLLEVIDNNERAISVYKRIGFEIDAKLCSFDVEFDRVEDETYLVLNKFDTAYSSIKTYQNNYSWDFRYETLIKKGKDVIYYDIYRNKSIIGYAVVIPSENKLAQIESIDSELKYCFSAMASRFHSLKMINISEEDKSKFDVINTLKNTVIINQYLMSRKL